MSAWKPQASNASFTGARSGEPVSRNTPLMAEAINSLPSQFARGASAAKCRDRHMNQARRAELQPFRGQPRSASLARAQILDQETTRPQIARPVRRVARRRTVAPSEARNRGSALSAADSSASTRWPFNKFMVISSRARVKCFDFLQRAVACIPAASNQCASVATPRACKRRHLAGKSQIRASSSSINQMMTPAARGALSARLLIAAARSTKARVLMAMRGNDRRSHQVTHPRESRCG